MARPLCLVLLTILGVSTCYSQNLKSSVLKAQKGVIPNLAKEVEDNSRYKTLEANATVLKLLVDDKDGVSKSEVFDMLHSRDDNEGHVDLPSFPDDTENAKADVPAVPDLQAEVLQVTREPVRKDVQRLIYYSGGEAVSKAAGIMVVVTCSIVIVAYTALVVWRKIYLKRIGLKHELLRNEEVDPETRIESNEKQPPCYDEISKLYC